MQQLSASRIVTGVIYFLHMALTLPNASVNADQLSTGDKEKTGNCLKGHDPICYFPSSEGAGRTRRINTNTNTFVDNDKDKPIIFPQPETYYVESSVGTEGGLISAERDNPEEDEHNRYYDFPDDISLDFKPLDGTEIEQPELLQYGLHWTQLDNTYPPWTYRGFYPPSEWHLIPWTYFNPKKTGSGVGVYTGEINQKQIPGISFMEFPELLENKIKLHLENCSNSLYPSPLDIIRANAKEDYTFGQFNFMNFDVPYAFIMFIPEDGTDLLFVKLQTPVNDTSKKPNIESGAVTGQNLFLDRLLIHMGEFPENGSEHRIDGQSFGMELQFFFNKQSTLQPNIPYYATLKDYMINNNQPELYGKDLLVLCVLVVVVPEDGKPPIDKKFNKGMALLSEAAEQFDIRKNRKKYRSFANTQEYLTMDDFFQEIGHGEYYTYYGSLTHPPCLNNTRYVIFETPIYVSTLVWRRFLYIPSQFSDSGFLAPNFRPMNSLTFTDKHTNKVVRYEEPHSPYKERLSRTVSKSRKLNKNEDSAEYDYYDSSTSTFTVLPLGSYLLIITVSMLSSLSCLLDC